MKKIIALAFLAMMMVGCSKNTLKKEASDAIPIIIVDEQGDSCEYYTNYGHKGNCKYCLERNKKMVKEQIDTALIEIFD